MGEFGPEISVDGMPSWLGGDEKVKPRWDKDDWYPDISLACCVASPESVTAIRLRADHPYYLATSKGFTYWPGGESAPDDWDGGEVLLRHRGRYAGCAAWIGDGIRWHHVGIDDDIIGYRKRSEPIDSHMNKVRYNAPFAPSNRPSDELVERMIAHFKKVCDDHKVQDEGWDSALDEARSILSELNPIDPVVKRAREICAKTTNSASQKRQFSDGELDDGLSMEAVIRALREGM